MFKKLVLRNFKGIEKGELELSPLTVLIGANNSGKTSVLEALFLLPNPFRSVPYRVVIWESESHRFVERNFAASVLEELHKTLESRGFAFLLHNYTARYALVTCTIDGQVRSLVFVRDPDRIRVFALERGVRPEEISEIERVERELGDLSLFSSKLSVNRGSLLTQDTLIFKPALIKPVHDSLRAVWIEITNKGIGRKVAMALSELSAEDYLDLSMEEFGGRKVALSAYLSDGKRIRLSDLGDGIQLLATLMVLTEYAEPSALLWDDVESHMNPRALVMAAEWLTDQVKGGRQVVATTHSLEAAKLIASFCEDANVEYSIKLLKLKDGELRSRSLSLEDVEELGRAGIDVRLADALL